MHEGVDDELHQLMNPSVIPINKICPFYQDLSEDTFQTEPLITCQIHLSWAL